MPSIPEPRIENQASFNFDKLLDNLNDSNNDENDENDMDDTQTELNNEFEKIYDVLIDLEDPDVFKKIIEKVKTEEDGDVCDKQLKRVKNKKLLDNENEKNKILNQKIMVKNQSNNGKMNAKFEYSENIQINPFDSLKNNGPSLDCFLDEVEGDEIIEITEDDMNTKMKMNQKNKDN